MKRPFASSRPIGPFSEQLEVLQVRRQCSPVVKFDLAEQPESEEVFNLIENRARFEVDDIILDVEEGEVGTREPMIVKVSVFSEEQDVDLLDIEHIRDVMEREYEVLKTRVSGSVEEDPEDVGIPESIEGPGFIEEETEL